MKLKKLFKGLDIVRTFGDIDITSISTDSREVKNESLFIAIRGFTADGHRFVNDALKKGARIALVEKGFRENKNVIRVKDTRKALSVIASNFYSSPSRRIKVLGVTGTNGKTTVSFLLKSIFDTAKLRSGVIGTIEYTIGKMKVKAVRTTPDALKLNMLLSKAFESGLKAVSMEASSHALDQGRTDGILLDAAVFTNLTHEHLDYHVNLKKYLEAKAKIFKNLKKNGVAILNADDKSISFLQKRIKNKVVTYGLKGAPDVTVGICKMTSNGSEFSVNIKGKKTFLIKTKLVGMHNISNILAAVACGVSCGIDTRDIKKGIEKVGNIRGRLESVESDKGFKVFVDYAHTHNALENVLSFLNMIKKKNLITVFGCGGERDKKKRPLMGNVATRLSDFVIITSDNPRGENPKEIIKDIKLGIGKEKKNHIIVVNRKSAIKKALRKAKKDDIVLLSGKGHEKFQIIGRRKIPFDDRKVAKEILKKKCK